MAQQAVGTMITVDALSGSYLPDGGIHDIDISRKKAFAGRKVENTLPSNVRDVSADFVVWL